MKLPTRLVSLLGTRRWSLSWPGSVLPAARRLAGGRARHRRQHHRLTTAFWDIPVRPSPLDAELAGDCWIATWMPSTDRIRSSFSRTSTNSRRIGRRWPRHAGGGRHHGGARHLCALPAAAGATGGFYPRPAAHQQVRFFRARCLYLRPRARRAPADLAAARELWRQQLRASTAREAERQEARADREHLAAPARATDADHERLRSDDVLEIYLNALATSTIRTRTISGMNRWRVCPLP